MAHVEPYVALHFWHSQDRTPKQMELLKKGRMSVGERVSDGKTGFCWKNGFQMEERVSVGRAGFSWKNGFLMEELVSFGRTGFSWKNGFRLE
jgi:hypothetical protein